MRQIQVINDPIVWETIIWDLEYPPVTQSAVCCFLYLYSIYKNHAIQG